MAASKSEDNASVRSTCASSMCNTSRSKRVVSQGSQHLGQAAQSRPFVIIDPPSIHARHSFMGNIKHVLPFQRCAFGHYTSWSEHCSPVALQLALASLGSFCSQARSTLRDSGSGPAGRACEVGLQTEDNLSFGKVMISDAIELVGNVRSLLLGIVGSLTFGVTSIRGCSAIRRGSAV